MSVNYKKLNQAEKSTEQRVKSDEKGKHTAKSLRGFLQYDGKPVSIEELCQPVEYFVIPD